jgi:hypothetical protein
MAPAPTDPIVTRVQALSIQHAVRDARHHALLARWGQETRGRRRASGNIGPTKPPGRTAGHGHADPP